MTEEDEELEKGWKQALSRRTRRICCGAFHPPFFVPSCLPFSHSSLEKQQRLQDRRKPRPRTARSDSLFFMQFPRFVCPRHRAPHDSFPPPGIHPRDHRSRKTSLRAWEFKGTTSPATSMWMWQIKERGEE